MRDTAILVGIDEAGRGPLAGPVVAAACHLPCSIFRRRRGYGAWSPFPRRKDGEWVLADSKVLEEEDREAAYAWIVAHCPYGVAMTDAHEIDTLGILAATERAMQEAVSMLARSVTPTYLLIDGKDGFWFDYPHSSVIRGDGTEPCIAAASILAKVTRDRLMRSHAETFPQYAFDRHKGYGTEIHHAALREHGPCVLHRRSFLRAFFAASGYPPTTKATPPPAR